MEHGNETQATKRTAAPSYLGMLITSPARAKHFAAMVLIGDGVMAVVHPEKDASAWKTGPKPWRDLMHGLSERPNLTRAIGVVQIVGGIWWALHQDKED